MYPANSFRSTVESSLVERYVKVHITQNSQCFTIRGHYHSTRLMKTRFLCTGVVSSKLAQPLIQRNNGKTTKFCGSESVRVLVCTSNFFWLVVGISNGRGGLFITIQHRYSNNLLQVRSQLRISQTETSEQAADKQPTSSQQVPNDFCAF